MSTMAGDNTKRKTQRTSTPSALKMSEDTAACAICEKTFASEEDKLMICERCEDSFCIKYIKMKVCSQLNPYTNSSPSISGDELV